VDFDLLSLFPEYFRGPFDESMLKRAKEKGIISIRCVNIRDFSKLRHARVDDTCYGGGPGMVLMAEPVRDAILSVKRETSHVIYLTPQGKPLTAKRCRELAQKEHLVVLCGHYEGIDERALSYVDEEISIGDYVLTSGAPAAIVLVDAVSRFVPGVIGDETAASQDSFENGLLECPHYTKPAVFEGKAVPEVLLNGNHKEIDRWRKEEAYKKTAKMRPELLNLSN
jgi:tRNA (guanine37-N1)-methyltransferase